MRSQVAVVLLVQVLHHGEYRTAQQCHLSISPPWTGAGLTNGSISGHLNIVSLSTFYNLNITLHTRHPEVFLKNSD